MDYRDLRFDPPQYTVTSSTGPTLRQYYAAKAMQGIMIAEGATEKTSPGWITKNAFDVADAMIEFEATSVCPRCKKALEPSSGGQLCQYCGWDSEDKK